MAKKAGNKQQHLRKEERFCIEQMVKAGDTFTHIATTLMRGLSTISEEVNANGGRTKYNAAQAHRRAYWKQYCKKRGCNKVAMDAPLTRFVEQELRERRSPEAIATQLKARMVIGYASGKSIRKFIRKRPSLERFLFWHRVHKKGGLKKHGDIFLADPGRKSIDERPMEAHTVYGHWEMDFIVSVHSSTVLLVLVEQQTKLIRMCLLPDRANTTVNTAVLRLLMGYTVSSITTDNDIGFTHWRILEFMIGAPIYFCHPYHSWEKGLVENTNRWIREFIKKKTDIAGYTEDYVTEIEVWLNHGPRVCLQGASAYEMMMQKEYNKFVSSLSVSYPVLRIGG